MGQQLKPIFIFPFISLWNFKYLCNGNKINVKDNAINISAKFQLYPPYSFWEVDFFLRKFSLLVAGQTNQIERFGQKVYEPRHEKTCLAIWEQQRCRSACTYLSHGNKKNNIFTEANVINISAKFQLYPSYRFVRVDF